MNITQAFHSNPRLLYIVCQDETHALKVIEQQALSLQKRNAARMKNPLISIRVHNMVWGVRLLEEVYREWKEGKDIVEPSTLSLVQALRFFSRLRNVDNPQQPQQPAPPAPAPVEDEDDEDDVEVGQESVRPVAVPARPLPRLKVKFELLRDFLVILDADRHFRPEVLDYSALRVIKNLYNQAVRNPNAKKTLIFVGKTAVVPEAIADMVDVVHLDPIDEETLNTNIPLLAKMAEVTWPNSRILKDLTLGQVQSSFFRQLYLNPKPGMPFNTKAIDEIHQEVLKQSGGLLSLLQPEETFDSVGGLDRFKDWARLIAPTWTPEGQAAGLLPPRGVLAVGVWGVGKSLAIKAMAKTWGLPLLSLELGKLRSGLIGSSENNLYRVLKIIEKMGDCVVLVDEADKSLSGSASSGNTDGGVGLRMLGILSTWMQESKSRACFGFTSNGVANIPVEFINRLDYRFFFDVPRGNELIEVLKVLLEQCRWPVSSYSLARLAEASDGMVSREIRQALDEARLVAYQEKPGSPPSQTILEKVFARKTRILDTKKKEIKELQEWVSYDPERKEGRNARLASSPIDDSGFQALEVL